MDIHKGEYIQPHISTNLYSFSLLRQNFILSISHTVGTLVPQVVSLFTPVDDIMWAGVKHSNKAIECVVHFLSLNIC